MGDPQGFLKNSRAENGYRPVNQRVQDYDEIEVQISDDKRKAQAARCMDCGVPFCHWQCPVGSLIPEWQDKLYRGNWKDAYDILQKTNNFPEFTGRLCPAPCESSCVLGINDKPVTIRENELAVIERAFAEGWIKANPPTHRTGKRIAVIGSGPAGLACADSLNKLGHSVVLFEASDKVGGYLRYGVPDFKLDKGVIDRRVNLMIEEGVEIQTGVRVGVDLPVDELFKSFDAACITIGARAARDLPIPGRELDGIHMALDYLEQSNRAVSGETIPDQISANGKHVIVIGGGDTGSDCVGTANRQGARSVTQIELLPPLPQDRTEKEPWPLYARLYKTSSSQAEGCERLFNVQTKTFIPDESGYRVNRLSCVSVDWNKNNGRNELVEVPGSEFELPADLVLLAMGFVHVEQQGFVKDLDVELDKRGNIATDANFMTNIPGIFAAGDSVRGASLVVWAIQEGRMAAAGIHTHLK